MSNGAAVPIFGTAILLVIVGESLTISVAKITWRKIKLNQGTVGRLVFVAFTASSSWHALSCRLGRISRPGGRKPHAHLLPRHHVCQRCATRNGGAHAASHPGARRPGVGHAVCQYSATEGHALLGARAHHGPAVRQVQADQSRGQQGLHSSARVDAQVEALGEGIRALVRLDSRVESNRRGTGAGGPVPANSAPSHARPVACRHSVCAQVVCARRTRAGARPRPVVRRHDGGLLYAWIVLAGQLSCRQGMGHCMSVVSFYFERSLRACVRVHLSFI
jgi:hypothetical protein